jgi:hypothetical protein
MDAYDIFCEGMAAEDNGDFDTAVEKYEESAQAYEDEGFSDDAALAHQAAGYAEQKSSG